MRDYRGQNEFDSKFCQRHVTISTKFVKDGIYFDKVSTSGMISTGTNLIKANIFFSENGSIFSININMYCFFNNIINHEKYNII